jgi:hypothetical protein
VLHHGPDLLPKKPFDEVLNLKTTHSSSSGSGHQLDGVDSRGTKRIKSVWVPGSLAMQRA